MRPLWKVYHTIDLRRLDRQSTFRKNIYPHCSRPYSGP
nr:MAG TPA: hypothetical protein [Caudoviricetes sp.]